MRYFRRSFIRYLAYALAFALISFVIGILKTYALGCEVVGQGGAEGLNTSNNYMYIYDTSPGNIAGFLYYKSSSDNGYFTFICDTSSGPSQSSDLLYQNIIVQGVTAPIIKVVSYTGFGAFSAISYSGTDFYSNLVGNYNFGFGSDSSGYNNDYGFVYGFSAISTSPAKISFRVFVPKTSDRSLLSFYTYDGSYEFIQGGTPSSFADALNSFNVSNDNYNTDRITNSIDNVNDTINDDNISGASSDANDFFSNFTTNTHGLTSIITAPLTSIASLTSSTCSPLVLPLPFVNSTLTLPCMRQIYDDNFGAFMTIYDIIVIGIISYWIIVRIFTLVKDFKNPEHDEVEVMEL